MVLIPTGNFLMGTSEEQLAAWMNAHPNDNRPDLVVELPQHSVFLDAFYIYKYDVTVAEFRVFCQATRRAMPLAPSWGWQDAHPILVNWNDAAAYAKWAGAALPTEAQWEKAARGVDGRIYPWGDIWDDAKCNFNGGQNPAKTSPVGSFPAGASPYGVMDMVGNVFQWCSDWFDENYYQHSPTRNPTGPSTGTLRVMRGGSWRISGAQRIRVALRGRYLPIFSLDDDGFRCVVCLPEHFTK